MLSLRLAHTGRLIGVLSGGELTLRPASSALARQPPTARKCCEAGSGATGCDRGRGALLVRANLLSFQGAQDVDCRVTRLRCAGRVRQPGCCDGTSPICLKDGELPAGAPTTCAWGTLEERRSLSTQTSTSAGALPGLRRRGVLARGPGGCTFSSLAHTVTMGGAPSTIGGYGSGSDRPQRRR